MADAVVGFLLDNITRILSQEINLLLGVENEVQLLRDDLNLIHMYLKRSEDPENEDAVAKEYVNQVRLLVHKAEDVVDSHVADVILQRSNIWKKISGWATNGRVSEEIISIRSRLNTLYGRRDEFGGQKEVREQQRYEHLLSQKRRDPFEETDMVGFDEETKSILKQLTQGPARLQVIPIVGMSGIGKTTLASRVYNDPAVEDYFTIRAWVHVSQKYNKRVLLESMIKCFREISGDDAKKSNDELSLEVQRYLRSSRFLVVLDDVWQADFWKDVSKIFSGNLYGSRVILTTQRTNVASSVPSSSRLELRFLTKAESWELLKKRVFADGECPSQLENLGQDIAKECKGLPLAIVVIAGVLKKHCETWWWSRVVSSSVNTYINEQTEEGCADILALSYNYLPFHLRQCFLYFGLFPEDHEIPARLLIRLWIAEGFIPKKETRTEEAVAEEYLEELIARNLIQIVKHRSDGAVKSCRIHDLLRVFCISKAKEEQYLEVRGSVDPSSVCRSRRLGLHYDTLQYVSFNPSSNLRSLLFFGHDEDRVSSKNWKSLCKGYMLLRVLDLWGVIVDSIPSEIGKLICLRFLRIKSDKATTIPATIYNLWNLQTLEVIAPLIERPEINIWKMRQLRHFKFNGDSIIPEPPKKMAKDPHDFLNNLQTLSSISPECCTKSILSELRNLVKLGLYGDFRRFDDRALKRLSKLSRLQSLKLVRDLRYSGLTRLPSAEFPNTLTKLTISRLELSEDSMKQLMKLPQLRVLKLEHDAYAGNTLDCRGVGFPRLEVLKLVSLNVKSWVLSTESMTNLRSLVVNSCQNLSNLPSSLKDRPAFQELLLWWPNVSLSRSAKEIKALKEAKNERFKLVLINSADPSDDM